ncbi:PQQ-binding-like beta-propeller repeat protein [Dactylosporangium sp. NPDC051484]|uniref:outer membrane protein assembly factor BamB family protein n=1 Tax=Dactylosporangium sp. NPDC051484 TaxID=3154942 RepID=UPI00344B005C
MRRCVAVLAAALVLAACGGDPAPVPADDGNWPTYHRDNARTGNGPSAPPATRLAKAWEARLDGAVYGQPLVIGTRVLAATENDTVYALDARSGAVLWSAHVGTPVPGSALPCGDIDPLGITGTMAYDARTKLVFAVAESTGGAHTLVGVDVDSGEVRLRRAVEPPLGDRLAHQQRAALTVWAGRVYIAYGGLAGDCAKYIGSVVSAPTSGDGELQSYAVPTSRRGGIWSPGGGAVIGQRLYYAVGNGASTTGFDGSDTVIALDRSLRRTGYFAPDTWAEDNAGDLDLGSMTPALVPGPGGDKIFIAGKRGVGYVLDPADLGGIGGQRAKREVCAAFGGAAVAGTTLFVPCDDGVRAVTVDTASGRITVGWHGPDGTTGSPVLAGGSVWVVDVGAGVLHLLDPADGHERPRLDIGRAPHFASPTVARGHGYVGTLTGVVAVEY